MVWSGPKNLQMQCHQSVELLLESLWNIGLLDTERALQTLIPALSELHIWTPRAGAGWRSVSGRRWLMRSAPLLTTRSSPTSLLSPCSAIEEYWYVLFDPTQGDLFCYRFGDLEYAEREHQCPGLVELSTNAGAEDAAFIQMLLNEDATS